MRIFKFFQYLRQRSRSILKSYAILPVPLIGKCIAVTVYSRHFIGYQHHAYDVHEDCSVRTNIM